MSAAIKKTYVIEWQGPFSLDEINEIKDKRNSGSLYLVSGLQRYQHGQSVVQYIGISKRGAAIRFKDQGHKSELVSRECQFWLGHITNTSEKNKDNRELAEYALVYTCQPSLNKMKKSTRPHEPVVVINRWLNEAGEYRQRRVWPVQKDVPDIILFDGDDIWTCESLKWESML